MTLAFSSSGSVPIFSRFHCIQVHFFEDGGQFIIRQYLTDIADFLAEWRRIILMRFVRQRQQGNDDVSVCHAWRQCGRFILAQQQLLQLRKSLFLMMRRNTA